MLNIKKSILVKTFLTIFLISIFFFGILFSIFFSKSTKYLKDQIRITAQQNMELMNSCIDLVFSNINNIIYMVTNDDTLYSGDVGSINGLLADYKNANSKIISLMMLISGDDIVAIDTPYRLIGANMDTSLYHNLSEPNKLVITDPYYSSLTSSRTIGFIRSIVDKQTGEELLLVTEIKTSNIFALLNNLMTGDNETLIILAQDSSTIYMDYSSKMINNLSNLTHLLDLNEEFRTLLYNLPYGINEISYNKNSVMVLKGEMTLNWTIYLLVNYNKFYNVVMEMTYKYIRIAVIAIVLLVVISILISSRFVKPVKNLAIQMDAIKTGENPRELTPINRQDEIGDLWLSFNNLMNRLNSTMEEKLAIEMERIDLEYKVLQSQIQPHFLLNTLLCIKSLMDEGEMAQAKQMLLSFNILLSNSIDKTQALIPLKKEIDTVNAYVTLQKLRMGDSFDYEIGDWNQFADILVPRLLLQPVIENSLYHGISDIDWRGKITIEIMEIDNYIHIFVTDNGKGISPKQQKEIFQKNSEQGGKYGMVSIGLSNVENRIKGFFGADCGLYISSRENIGTKVELVIRKS